MVLILIVLRPSNLLSEYLCISLSFFLFLSFFSISHSLSLSLSLSFSLSLNILYRLSFFSILNYSHSLSNLFLHVSRLEIRIFKMHILYTLCASDMKINLSFCMESMSTCSYTYNKDILSLFT